MKKVKIKERFENAVEAFFNDENLGENNSLDFSSRMDFQHEESAASFKGKAGSYLKILRQVFLFFPGAFILFYLSLGLTVLTVNPPPGVTLEFPVRFLLFFSASFLMILLGLGDLRKPKHLAIPLSVILAGVSCALISIISGLSGILLRNDKYAIYLFPVALIVPFLAKGWVDKTSEEKPSV